MVFWRSFGVSIGWYWFGICVCCHSWWSSWFLVKFVVFGFDLGVYFYFGG